MAQPEPQYDALLVVSFGGPDNAADVMPFLENVLRGKNVPPERMLEVAEHYYQLGGASPINAQSRSLVEAVRADLARHGPDLPVFWGNRNWHPLLAATIRQMADRGVRRALAFVTSAYSSYSGCRQYLEDIERARAEVGPAAPPVHKLRAFYNHPRFVEAEQDRVETALGTIPAARRATARLVFTAHSIPAAMARGCAYEAQLQETCRLVSQRVGPYPWQLVYQSRSGPPGMPWLEPDIRAYLRQLAGREAVRDLVVVPVGFLSDHLEVQYDLDVEAGQLCGELGIQMVRADTVGTHPGFVTMIRELVAERLAGGTERPALGALGPSPDVCPSDCCPSGRPR